MISSRGLLGVALLTLSLHTPHVQSQPAAPGSAAPSPADPAEVNDDEIEMEGDDGTGGPRPGVLVAPKHPKARLEWLDQQLAAAVAARPALARAKITYAVTDLASADALVSRDADEPMNLASNTKLLTATAALAGLGSGFRWRTAVHTLTLPDETGTITGDLYIRGHGDPTLTTADLRQLAADVAARGVRNVEGKLVVDATYFDDQVEPPHFDEQPDERAAFRAPVASLGVDRSAFTLTVMAEPGGASRITVVPVTNYIKVTKQEVTSVPTGRTRLRLETKTKRDAIEIEITGQIRANEGSWDLRRRVDDPARFAAEVFKKALADHDVRIRKRAIGYAALPPISTVIAHHDSAPLNEVIRLMNKRSDNYVAESVLKTIGAELKTEPGPATWTNAIGAVAAQLAKFGLVPGSYRAGNGSGLFASTAVSARQLLAVLAGAHKDYRIGPDLVASLPVGGLDGTLARRWHGKPALGRVRAKTGTLEKVTTLAGYIANESNHVLAFAILVNDIPAGKRGAVRAMADEMVDALAAYLGAT